MRKWNWLFLNGCECKRWKFATKECAILYRDLLCFNIPGCCGESWLFGGLSEQRLMLLWLVLCVWQGTVNVGHTSWAEQTESGEVVHRLYRPVRVLMSLLVPGNIGGDDEDNCTYLLTLWSRVLLEKLTSLRS
jgi:hypothetical protein